MNNQYEDRKYIITTIFLAVVIIFFFRLFYIQIIDDKYKLTAKNQAFRYITNYPARGNIFDRKEKRLVCNQSAFDLMVIPKLVKNLDTTEFCQVLGIDEQTFLSTMKKATRHPNSPRKPSIFAKEISVEQSSQLQEKLYSFPGFFLQSRRIRGVTT